MKVTVENPTHKDKAVRAAGGLFVVRAGDTAQFDKDWSAAQVSAYEAAGLVVSRGSELPDVTLAANTVHEAVADALMSLLPEVGGDGVPNVSAVRAHVATAMGITQSEAKDAVTTKLRNAVWAELQE